jgi:hypothetical protein
VGFESEVSTPFLCCLALIHFVRQLFCGDLHQTWCIHLVHEKVHQCFWVFWVRCEAVGPGVRPLISAWIVVLSSASGIWDLYCMNLLTKFRNGSLSFCLQLYKFDDRSSCCFMKYLECLNELCLEIDPTAD